MRALPAPLGCAIFVFGGAELSRPPVPQGRPAVVASPNGNSGLKSLLGDLAVVGADDIWAVGNQGNGSSRVGALIEHWDGAEWNVIPSPNGVFPVNYLTSISAA